MSCPHNLAKVYSLEKVLSKGNETCGHDIIVSSGDKITSPCLALESVGDAGVVIGCNRTNYIGGTDYTKAEVVSYDVEKLSLSSAVSTQIDSGGTVDITANGKIGLHGPLTHVTGDLYISGRIIMDKHLESCPKSCTQSHPAVVTTESLPCTDASLSVSLPIIRPEASCSVPTSSSSESCPDVSVSCVESCPTECPPTCVGVIQFGEIQESCTRGGDTQVCHNWTVRPLNFATGRNVQFDLEKNKIIFRETGVYTISGFSSFYAADPSTISVTRFSSVTSTPKEEIRTVMGSNVYGSGNSNIAGMFTVSIPSTAFTLQYRTSHAQCGGLGRPSNLTANTYASFVVTKIA